MCRLGRWVVRKGAGSTVQRSQQQLPGPNMGAGTWGIRARSTEGRKCCHGMLQAAAEGRQAQGRHAARAWGPMGRLHRLWNQAAWARARGQAREEGRQPNWANNPLGKGTRQACNCRTTAIKAGKAYKHKGTKPAI